MRQSLQFPLESNGGPFATLSSLKNALLLLVIAAILLVNFVFRASSPTQLSHRTSLDLDEFHYFDEVLAVTYDRATVPENTQRRPYALDDSWIRGNGGLDDDDRKTLFDIYYNANSVFEWGLGESTLIAAKVGVPRYSGVDSDPEWVGGTRQKAKDQFGISHFRFLYADIGDVEWFGNPVENTLKKIQYNYQVAPLAGESKPFDVYMVDGRYRVACACVAFLHALKLGADMENVRVMVHDNDDEWRNYDRIERIGEVLVRNKKLWVYKLRKGTTEEEIFKLWKEFEKEKA